MAETLTFTTVSAAEAAALAEVRTSPNGIRYGAFGEIDSTGLMPLSHQLPRLVGTVPANMTAALAKNIFYFVPLAMASQDDRVTIAAAHSDAAAEQAICHRNARVHGDEGVFISTRLHTDNFAIGFEFFINAAHNFVDTAGVPEAFSTLVWQQAQSGIKGETSRDAFDHRERALKATDEKVRLQHAEAAFADTLAIYMLSLFIDLDYADLREREYPLLDARALADRLRTVNRLFPANAGYEFSIRYRRR